jgi:hypothetical protein
MKFIDDIIKWFDDNKIQIDEINYFSTSVSAPSKIVVGHLFLIFYKNNLVGATKIKTDGSIKEVYFYYEYYNKHFDERNFDDYVYQGVVYDPRIKYREGVNKFELQGFSVDVDNIYKLKHIYLFFEGLVNYYRWEAILPPEEQKNAAEIYSPNSNYDKIKKGTVRVTPGEDKKVPVATYDGGYDDLPESFKYYLDDWEHNDKIIMYRFSDDTPYIEYKDPNMKKYGWKK